ncbi:MAG: phosphodiester glycosidase family protein, partial [Thermicanus sp.]|nr:phosphodiester glycosidase family protein [Thermicanus sp.]
VVLDLAVRHFSYVEAFFNDHYFKGKILYIPDPKMVKMVTSTTPDRGEQIQVLAKKNGAIAAINANGFHDPNGQGNGGIPLGIIIENGVIMNAPNNNPDEKDYVAGLTKDGVLITGFYSAHELIRMGVTDAGGFKPQLIVNGEKMIKKGNGGWGIAPRTAIGQREDGTIVMIVIEGRQVQSLGATLKDVQDLLYERGVVNAICMDGGSSSIMYLNGETITTPSSQGNISRFLPNAWVVIPEENQEINIVQKPSDTKSKG